MAKKNIMTNKNAGDNSYKKAQKALKNDDSNEGQRLLLKSAEQGHAGAQFNLGIMYHTGKGVAQDYVEAFDCYKLAAEQGYADAQINLGIMYYLGEGVAQDYGQAAHWNKLAAEQGYADAQINLGNMYYSGQGVAQDYEQAKHYYRLAVEEGDENAAIWLERLEKQGSDDKKFLIQQQEPKIERFPVQDKEIKMQSALQSLRALDRDSMKEVFSKAMNEENFGDLPKHIFEQSLEHIIEKDETQEIEFKETFSLPTKKDKSGQDIKQDVIRYAALKEITGFLNTRDGVLLIGVIDKKNSPSGQAEISGIELDKFDGDKDKYARTITDLVKTALGETAATLINISFQTFDNKTVCRIDCSKSSQPVYCDFKSYGEKPFIRYGSPTTEPPQKEWVRWLNEKFPKVSVG